MRVKLPAARGTRIEWRRTRYLYMDARRLAKDTDQDLMITRGRLGSITRRPRISVCSMLNARASSILITIWSLSRFWQRELDIDDADAVAVAVAEAGGDCNGFKSYLAGGRRG